jgi:cytochrome c-type biogenesis protein CcmF
MAFDLKVGDLGHIFAITSFIASVIASFSYWKSSTLNEKFGALHNETLSWKKFARGTFYFHAASVIGVVTTLFLIIYNHRYEYYYAWDHSSNDLPVYYMISCFWEGQEGSFLLWIFWHAVLGTILINVNRTWEAPLMAVFCLVQAFLASMIIGVVIPFAEIKIGSSPFILFKEHMGHLPLFVNNPDYIPTDGSGLNALLQNYWMVIHPPTLFLGFALTVIPFAYCIAGLWQKKYKEWIRPALPWALVGALVLGTGIIMGAYWAYETLNFGGYWNWDPVENAVYVPWLVLVGSIHTMITFRNSEKALKASVILVITSFLLILYSTFLTRSGILGNSSVHSFTDLGLSGQLLIYLLFFTLLSKYIVIRRWKEIPGTEKEDSAYSREFWIFIGVTVLCLAAFQVIATTSIPVYNAFLGIFDIESNLAPPANQEEHYSSWQIWFAIAIAILSGAGQFFWWQKVDKKKLKNALALPLIISLLTASVIILLVEIKNISYILLLTASIFSIAANFIILKDVVKNNYKLSGGAVAHIGVAMMLIGILFSSGYSRIVSLNTSGVKYSSDAALNRDNVLLWRGEPVKMEDFTLTYKGSHVEAKGFPGYIPKEKIFPTANIYKVAAKENIFYKDELYFKRGDTLEISPENSFYEILFEKEDGESFTLYPRVQMNEQMGFVVSPDIRRFIGKDLYTHISSIPKVDEEREWSDTEEHSAKVKDTMYLHDYVAILENVITEKTYPGITISKKGIAVKAEIKILGKYDTYKAEPYMIWINESEGGRIPDVIEDLGMQVTFLTADPATHKFTFSVSTSERDYVILKAIEKPVINFLWIGTFLLIIGLFIAIVRRYSEFAKMRDKGIE